MVILLMVDQIFPLVNAIWLNLKEIQMQNQKTALNKGKHCPSGKNICLSLTGIIFRVEATPIEATAALAAGQLNSEMLAQ